MDQLELVDGKLYLVVAPPSLLLGLHAQVDGQLFHAAVNAQRFESTMRDIKWNADRQTDGHTAFHSYNID